MRRGVSVFLVCLAAPILSSAQPAPETDWIAQAKAAKAAKTKPAEAVPVPVERPYTGLRNVGTALDSVPEIATKIRFSTMIELPPSQKVKQIHCGDCPTFWQVTHDANVVHVKPSEPNFVTNINVVTVSGRVYSFMLREIGKATTVPDIKVSVEDDLSAPTVAKWVDVEKYDAVQAELIEAKAQLEATRTRAAEAIEEAKRTRAPVSLKCDYGPIKDEKPFHVQSICHDDHFTYIRSTAKESFTVFELKDGEPHVLNIRGEEGQYVIPKVLERAYLAQGEKRFHITLRSGN